MYTAEWHDTVIAESEATIGLEGHRYFPAEAVDHAYLRPSDTTSVCPWKGVAHYYDVVVDGEVNHDAAWYYPDPSQAAGKITGHVAFWKGVRVSAPARSSDGMLGKVIACFRRG